MKEVKSCGFIIFSSNKFDKFLVLKHSNRYDLPKGHLEDGESEIDGALRELFEETSIKVENIEIDYNFRFETSYITPYKRFNMGKVKKTVVIFLAHITCPTEITLTEHLKFEWINFDSNLHFQENTLKDLTKKLVEYL